MNQFYGLEIANPEECDKPVTKEKEFEEKDCITSQSHRSFTNDYCLLSYTFVIV